MPEIIKTVIKAVPLLVGLFKSKTPEQGKGIIKSGVASLTISGLISTGRLSGTGIDGTLLLILSILEAIGYLYGMVAISSGAAQTDATNELLKGKGEGLSNKQAKILGREWLKQIQKNQDYRLPGNSLFDDDHSDLKIQAKDISKYAIHNTKEEQPMITILSFLLTAVLFLLSTEWLTGILTPNNLAEIGVVILGMIALSASVQIRALFEKAQNILRLYGKYTDPKSDEGSKLSPQEKERLLDLFLHELRIVVDQFGGRILIRVGGFIRKVFDKLFG